MSEDEPENDEQDQPDDGDADVLRRFADHVSRHNMRRYMFCGCPHERIH